MNDEDLILDSHGRQGLTAMHLRLTNEFDKMVAAATAYRTKVLEARIKETTEELVARRNAYYDENIALRDMLETVFRSGSLMPDEEILIRDFLYENKPLPDPRLKPAEVPL